MITTGQLRVFAKDFIGKLVDTDVVNLDDIRWLKSGNGIFPRKMIWAGAVGASEFKETPYSPNDTFILFDILQDNNIASERIGDRVYSHLPFTMIINIYGSASEDQVQYMLASLHTYGTKLWLTSQKISLTWVPDDIQILDGRENASWWIRRRFELKLNTQQDIEYNSGLENGDEIDQVVRNVRFVNEGR